MYRNGVVIKAIEFGNFFFQYISIFGTGLISFFYRDDRFWNFFFSKGGEAFASYLVYGKRCESMVCCDFDMKAKNAW